MNDPLTALAIVHGTDKFGYHDYAPNYFTLLKHLKDEPIRLLEIGVGGYSDEDRGGESLAMWRDFFTKGHIIGIDIQKKTLDLGDRVTVLQGSQIDPDFLDQLVREHGPFDVIIDDGSHQNEHVVTSFEILFPTLKVGGIYVVEDTQTAYHPRFGGSVTLDQPNSIGYFANLFAQIDHREMLVHHPDADVHPAASQIYSIQRFHNMIAMYKSANDYPSNFAFEFDHPTVRKVFDVMEDVLRTSETEKGLVQFAEILSRAGEDERADPLFAQLEAIGASTRKYYNLAVRRRMAAKEWDEATVLLRAARQKYPDDPRFAGHLGIVLSRSGDLVGAEDALHQAIELSPRDALLHVQLANVLAIRHKFDSALDIAEKAVKLAPGHAGHLLVLCRMQASAGKLDDAESNLHKALELQPDLPKAHRLMSAVRHGRGDLTGAFASIDRALEKTPDNAEFRRWRHQLTTEAAAASLSQTEG